MLRNVALTFESGGDPADCARTLAVLREMAVRATIFLDGRWAEANPALLQAIAADGHELGNHAYTHPDLTTLSAEQIAEELERTESLALRLTGRSTKPWFRPPFQRLDDRVRRIATQNGYRCLIRDALDGVHYLGAPTPQAILQRSLDRAVDGAVLTYHLHNRQTRQVLPEIVDRLRRGGVRFLTISELPISPAERSPLHPNFASLAVDPGFLRVHRPVPPPQMVNLLALGAEATAPADEILSVGRSGRGEIQMLVYSGEEPLALEPASGNGYVACLAGQARLCVTDAEGDVCSALARPGDVLEIREGWAVRVEPGDRAILLVLT